jgi:hypothetical protein
VSYLIAHRKNIFDYKVQNQVSYLIAHTRWKTSTSIIRISYYHYLNTYFPRDNRDNQIEACKREISTIVERAFFGTEIPKVLNV